MERKTGQRYSSEFRRQAVERMNACDNIVALAGDETAGKETAAMTRSRRSVYTPREPGSLY